MNAIVRFFQDIQSSLTGFRQYPIFIKQAIVYLVLAWMWHYISIFIISKSIQLEDNLKLKMYIIGPILVLLILSMRNWARVLTILCQGLSITLYLFLCAAFWLFTVNVPLGIISTVNLVLFSISTYFLMKKDTVEFVKLREQQSKGNTET